MKLTVPVAPHVKKFLLKEFGPEPIYVRANSDLGRVLVLPFSKGVHVPPDEFDLEKEGVDSKGLTAVVEFEVGFAFERGSIIPDRLLLLSSALNGVFRQALYYFAQGRRTLHNSELASVRQFLAIYGLTEDDIQQSTAIKIAQRERKERFETAA